MMTQKSALDQIINKAQQNIQKIKQTQNQAIAHLEKKNRNRIRQYFYQITIRFYDHNLKYQNRKNPY